MSIVKFLIKIYKNTTIKTPHNETYKRKSRKKNKQAICNYNIEFIITTNY